MAGGDLAQARALFRLDRDYWAAWQAHSPDIRYDTLRRAGLDFYDKRVSVSAVTSPGSLKKVDAAEAGASRPAGRPRCGAIRSYLFVAAVRLLEVRQLLEPGGAPDLHRGPQPATA